MVASDTVEHITGPVPTDDRAFLYGDGLFETMLAIDGRLCWPDLHRSRLLEGARRLKIACSWADAESALLTALPEEGAHILRLTVSRGSGPRGYGPAEGPPRLRVRSSALGRDPFQPLPPARLAVSSITLGDQPLLAGLKHCNRLENVLAAAEAQAAGVDDVLILNARGGVQCAASANVFAVAGDELVTPDCKRCGIAGTRRRLVMEELAPALNLNVVEKDLPSNDWRDIDSVFLSNSVAGIRVVEAIDDERFTSSDVLLALQQAYFERLQSCSVS